MIKNIVFDMGGVLVEYDPEIVCRQFMKDPAERREVCTSVFASPEWIMLDMGIIPEQDALKRMQARLSTSHAKEMAALCLARWHQYNMWPKKGMAELVRWVKDRGYGIYLCSNASLRLLDCYQEVIPGIEYFDGVLFSAEVKCMKPQKEMYQHLFARFSLIPQECFFIDDLQLNIDGSRARGMDGCCFADGNVGRLMECLKNLKSAN